MNRALSLALILAALPLLATAEPINTTTPTLSYNIKTLSFDRWCQDEQHYQATRCDQRLSGDVMAFEDYRSRVEQYDLKYEKDRSKEHDFERDFMHRDHSQSQPVPDVIAPSQQ